MPILLAVSWQPEAQEKLQLFDRPAKVPDGTYSTWGTPQFIHYGVAKGQFNKSYKVAKGRAGPQQLGRQHCSQTSHNKKGQTHMGKSHSAISPSHPSPQNPKQGRRGIQESRGGKADLDSNIPSKPPAGASEICAMTTAISSS